jgi:hypothetical protein
MSANPEIDIDPTASRENCHGPFECRKREAQETEINWRM